MHNRGRAGVERALANGIAFDIVELRVLETQGDGVAVAVLRRPGGREVADRGGPVSAVLQNEVGGAAIGEPLDGRESVAQHCEGAAQGAFGVGEIVFRVQADRQGFELEGHRVILFGGA